MPHYNSFFIPLTRTIVCNWQWDLWWHLFFWQTAFLKAIDFVCQTKHTKVHAYMNDSRESVTTFQWWHKWIDHALNPWAVAVAEGNTGAVASSFRWSTNVNEQFGSMHCSTRGGCDDLAQMRPTFALNVPMVCDWTSLFITDYRLWKPIARFAATTRTAQTVSPSAEFAISKSPLIVVFRIG